MSLFTPLWPEFNGIILTHFVFCTLYKNSTSILLMNISIDSILINKCVITNTCRHTVFISIINTQQVGLHAYRPGLHAYIIPTVKSDNITLSSWRFLGMWRSVSALRDSDYVLGWRFV